MIFRTLRKKTDNYTPVDLMVKFAKDTDPYYKIVHGKWGRTLLKDNTTGKLYDYNHWHIEDCDKIPDYQFIYVYLDEYKGV